jgi:uncharacterized protein YebE (UPF0316 family)
LFSAITTWEYFPTVVVPLLIFCARIMDVSIGTVRLICVARGVRYLAAALGFFEVLIWILAMSQIMNHLAGPVTYIAYAAGFATGNIVGIRIEERLSIGFAGLRIITQKDATKLVDALKDAGYGLTVVDAQGSQEPVKIIFTVIRRSELEELIRLVRKFNEKAFFTVEDIRSVSDGETPQMTMYRKRNELRREQFSFNNRK